MAVSATPHWGTTAQPPIPVHMPIEPTHQVSTPLCHFYHHTSRNYTTSSLAINKKRKQMLLSVECVAFLWPLCEWSHRAVNGQASDKECMERIFTPLTVMQEKVPEHNMVYRCLIWCVINIFEAYSNQNSFVCVAVSYSDNSSTCLSMLSSHDNWSSLQMPTHSSMMPLAHNSPSGTHSRFVYFFVVYLYCIKSTTHKEDDLRKGISFKTWFALVLEYCEQSRGETLWVLSQEIQMSCKVNVKRL